jgi:predicted DNA-binding transcriptional regulator AlpA
MPRSSLLADDNRILNDEETAEAMGISIATLKRLRVAGKDPARTQLSTRRFGYISRNVRTYLERNTEARP